jgi:hypothetical protein
MEVPTLCAPEHRDERGLAEPRDVSDCLDSPGPELRRGRRADAPEPLDRKRMEKRKLTAGRDDQQTIGLGDTARDLREELRRRDADRDRQPDPLPHLPLQARGDLRRRAGNALEAANVEEGLVDRQSLDERRRVVEDAVHGLARLGIRRHARRNDDCLRAQPPCLRLAHRGVDAVRLGLIAGSEDDAAADDHRPAAQTRVVPLLDRGVEGVDVGVQDRRLAHTNICSHTGLG